MVIIMKVCVIIMFLNKMEDDSLISRINSESEFVGVVSLVFGPNKIAEFFVSRCTIAIAVRWLVDNKYYG
jgi:hypothetical protein